MKRHDKINGSARTTALAVTPDGGVEIGECGVRREPPQAGGIAAESATICEIAAWQLAPASA